MKIFGMVFDYDLKIMQNSGRHWAPGAYKNKDYIFEYSAASFASFMHHNPHICLTIYTDDTELFLQKLHKYNVKINNLNLVNLTEKIHEWNSHSYAFWPLIKIFDYNLPLDNELVIKLDNDLTCKKPIDDMLNHKGAFVWKYERQVSRGRPYWGEIHATQKAFGTSDFPLFNTGVWGLTKEYFELAKQQIPTLTEMLVSVDISNVCYFPDNPEFKTKIYTCSDQVANNYFLHKNNVSALETHQWFDHHCYVQSKQSVLDSVSHLIK